MIQVLLMRIKKMTELEKNQSKIEIVSMLHLYIGGQEEIEIRKF